MKMEILKELPKLLAQAGLVPDILIIGSWIYVPILLIVLVYNLFSHKER
jgi:hypothetical protein